jgi:hypothetical protein
MQKKATWTLVAVGCVPIIALGWFLAFRWTKSALLDLRDQTVNSTQAAIDFAAGHTQLECVDETLVRQATCEGMTCEASAQMFLTTCLAHALPSPGFCEDVPSPLELLDATTWQHEACKRLGAAEPQRCQYLIAAVPQYCLTLHHVESR